jgi:hypothetical protein
MSKPLEGAMTDAGEKLAERWANFPGTNGRQSILEFCRAELERAAGIADEMYPQLGWNSHYRDAAKRIAAAIRKLKE